MLITGGTGSLGHALARHFLAAGAGKVGILSRDEVKQAQMARTIPDPRMRWLLGDVRDLARLEVAFYGYEIVVHAAALKRVDAVADSPGEVFRTNLDGTRNVLAAAFHARVPRVLFISSDKACYPTNAYGVSKAAAETEVVAWNRYSVPRGVMCSVLRYGNVLGSRGSVVHTWREQLVRGEPITITHPDMTRYIITMPQACRAVGWALSVMEGGEIFVPDLPAAPIDSLAWAVCGNQRVEPLVTGLRPGGEKLHETLLTLEESVRARDTGEGYWVIRPHLYEWRADVPWPGPTMDTAPRTSATARQMGVHELRGLLKDAPTGGV